MKKVKEWKAGELETRPIFWALCAFYLVVIVFAIIAIYTSGA